MGTKTDQNWDDIDEVVSERCNLLREESKEFKDCFTRFSFQAIAITCAGYLVIVRFLKDYPGLGLMCYLFVGLLYMVSEIGIYKYKGSNRVIGYVLTMQRLKTQAQHDHFDKRIYTLLAQTGWEEAMKAWRVVYYTMSSQIYSEPKFSVISRKVFNLILAPLKLILAPLKLKRGNTKGARYNNAISRDRTKDKLVLRIGRFIGRVWVMYLITPKLKKMINEKYVDAPTKPEINPNTGKPVINYWVYKWFQPDSLVSGEGHYESGGYLNIILTLITSLAYIGIIISFGWSIINLLEGENSLINQLIIIFLNIGLASFAIWIFIRINLKKRIIENGLASIHSTAIVWQSVLLLDLKAKLEIRHMKSLRGYIDKLSTNTAKFCEDLEGIQEANAKLASEITHEYFRVIVKCGVWRH